MGQGEGFFTGKVKVIRRFPNPDPMPSQSAVLYIVIISARRLSVYLQAGAADLSIGSGDPFTVSPPARQVLEAHTHRFTVERRLRRDFGNRP